MLPIALSVLVAAAAPPRSLKIDHRPIDCLLKDRFALVEAVVEPADEVQRVRAYFRSSLDPDSFFVDMSLSLGRFAGTLPKPKERAGPVVYSIEALRVDGTVRRTPEMSAVIVRKPEECPAEGRLAEVAPSGDLRVGTTTASHSKPRGFGGVAGVQSVVSATGEDSAAKAEPAAGAGTPPKPPEPTPTAAQPARAQEAAAPPRPAPGESEYQIGAQDILKINVFGHEDLTQTAIVQEDGTFFFPIIGRVKASDMTPRELAKKIATLLSQGYVRNPQVTVMVQEYRSKSIFVMGEVSHPGPIPYSGNMTVMEMLAKAGPTAGAGAEVIVLRPASGSSGPVMPGEVLGEGAEGAAKQVETIRINIRDIQMGQLDKNVLLRPNDTVFITQAARVFLLGEVRTPGPQIYTPGMTVRQAIINAGGFTADAAKGKVSIGRQVDGKYKEAKAGLDDPVQPGDTVTVKAKLF
jgi:polysaccharide biosynthesis/export protein